MPAMKLQITSIVTNLLKCGKLLHSSISSNTVESQPFEAMYDTGRKS